MHQFITLDWPALIRAIEADKSLSQAAIAELVGADQSTINRIARGDSVDPRSSIALRLIQLAGGSVCLPSAQGVPAVPDQPEEVRNAA